MDNQKVRVRTREELASREKCFLEIVDILEKNKIHFFIQAGVVLGARRDNYFIKWDWDVEFGIFEKEFIKYFDLIKSELLQNNFKIFHEINSGKDGKIDVYKDYNEKSTVYEILCWRHSWFKKRYYRWNINIPEKFFEHNHTIDFLGRKLYCPGPVDEYLSYQYGNWKIPKKTSVKSDYLSKSFYNCKENKFYKNIKDRIVKHLK